MTKKWTVPWIRVGIAAFRQSHERGQVAVAFMATLMVLLGLVGLVVDGGMMFINYRIGRIAVDSAALAAAVALDERIFLDTNAVALDLGKANDAAQYQIAQNGHGRVALTGVSVAGNQVTVTGSVSSPTFFLRLFNIPAVTFRLTAEAELAYGITEANQ